MNDPLWNIYLSAPWYWQLFCPLLLLLHAVMVLYNQFYGTVHVLGS